MFFTPSYLKDAQERRRLIRKVYFYRRHLLEAKDLELLRQLEKRFAAAIKTKNSDELKKLEAESSKILGRVGGHYFKHYHLFENVETFVVAAILAIGIRSFFLQPFKIPTNSMWPTYHGMTYTLTDGARERSLWERTTDLILAGTSDYRLVAPTAGEVRVPVFNAAERDARREAFRYTIVNKPILGIIPSQQRQYIFYIGDSAVPIYVPVEFGLDKIIAEKFFAQGGTLQVDENGNARTGINVGAGEAFLSFQLETGDMLFVDRFSYNFVPPHVGQPIVFRTRAIPGLTRLYNGVPDDKYYIKRLVGLPGDTLRIDEPTLLRNGAPITGSEIFGKNALRTPPYPGYQARYDLAGGQSVTVPAGELYAFGDNSPESLDSRAWAGLPKDQLVGRAVFIYYPFSSRWGFSK